MIKNLYKIEEKMSKISKDLYDTIFKLLNEQEAEPASVMTPEQSKKYHEELKKQEEENRKKYVNYETPEEKSARLRREEGEYDVFTGTRTDTRNIEDRNRIQKLQRPLERTSTYGEEMTQQLKNTSSVERPKPEPAPQATQGLESPKPGLQPKVAKVSSSREPLPQPEATKFPPYIPSLDRPVNIPPTPTKPGDFGYIPPIRMPGDERQKTESKPTPKPAPKPTPDKIEEKMSKISKDLYDTIFKLLNEQEAEVKPWSFRKRDFFELTPQERKIKEVERQAAIDRETDEQLSAIDPAMKLSDQPWNVADYENEARIKVDTGESMEDYNRREKESADFVAKVRAARKAAAEKQKSTSKEVKKSIITLIKSKYNLIK